MSTLGPGDEQLHYSDGSHRWTSPHGRKDQKLWEERVREHQHRHRERLGNRPATGRAGQPAGRISRSGRPGTGAARR
ncbi:hypothetical protein [Plantactinospora sp. KBS50]|uniref:hypothetical protein n=1 Tax=Plantactinospora sp. KBS50 TaxID=2024580 RepID=UPI000BAAA3D9|nr:hypothetical protein [Plantactinospora sp. KBS50]ASW56359.1 hypothetical protein CIK06_22675 [Plantactinospora sp. KBS50]